MVFKYLVTSLGATASPFDVIITSSSRCCAKKLYNAECFEKERQTLKNRSHADFIAGANWQKEQDEAKYKALLESHNDLLEAANKSVQIFKRLADEGKYPEFMLAQNGGEGFKFLTQAINKVKFID